MTMILQVTASIWPSVLVNKHAQYVESYFTALGFPQVKKQKGISLVNYEGAEPIQKVIAEIPVMETLDSGKVDLSTLAKNACKVLQFISAQGDVDVRVFDPDTKKSWHFQTQDQKKLVIKIKKK
jgi:hypothetical protein